MKIQTTQTKKMVILAMSVLLAFSACNQEKQTTSDNGQAKTEKVKAPRTPIHDAVISGSLETVKQHIAAKSDINEKDAFGGSTPLIIATVFGKTDIAEALIDAGAKVDITNNDGSTAVHSAAFFCRTEILEMLLEAGADKTVRNNFGSTALESVQVPFKDVESVYSMMGKQLSPMGLQLDMERIENTRPQIAEMLR